MTTDVLYKPIPEVHDRAARMGRFVYHDPRSRDFPAEKAATLHSVSHDPHGQALNQGQLGSCTTHALATALNCGTLFTGKVYTHPMALAAYKIATTLDDVPGHYPPTDTGSSGLGACKAGVKLGWIKSYGHSFSLPDLTAALMLRPVIIGISWDNNMFDPDPKTNILPLGGGIAGGHEICIRAWDMDRDLYTIRNSWGPKWGVKGEALITGKDLGKKLKDQGDTTVPQLEALPAAS